MLMSDPQLWITQLCLHTDPQGDLRDADSKLCFVALCFARWGGHEICGGLGAPCWQSLAIKIRIPRVPGFWTVYIDRLIN